MFDPTPWLLTWGHAAAPVLARALGLSWTAPAVGIPGLGWRIRLGLALLLTALLTPIVNVHPTVAGLSPGSASPAEWARLVLAEIATGTGLGLAMGLVLAAARLAGEVVGTQAGLSVAGLLDPSGGAGTDAEFGGPGTSPMGRLYGLTALGAFLALDGPLRLVGVLIESYRALPMGGPDLDSATVEAAFAGVGWALGLSLRAAAPAALALALSGIAFGLLARAASGLQILTLSLPIRAVLGLTLVLIGLSATASAFAMAWDEVLRP